MNPWQRVSWRRLAPLAALVPSLWFGRGLLLETPLGHDHATHLAKAWHFWNEMLSRGRLSGWSHFWCFGYPADELVPFGGELWVALARALTLGQLSWFHTYSLAFGAFLLLQSWAVFCFTRRYFGVVAGIAAAWLAALDPGAMPEGGWLWYGVGGVWPVSLCTSFALLALSRLEDAVSSRRRQDVAWVALWTGAALLTHQLALLLFAALAVLLVLDWALRPGAARLANALAGAAGLGLGLGLAAFWVVPFLQHGGQTQDLGRAGPALAVVAKRFVLLETFSNGSRVVEALSILGAVFALRRRVRGGLWITAAAAGFVVAASNTLIEDLHLERVLPSLLKIEGGRMLLCAKLFWFPLAGHALALLGRELLAAYTARGGTRRSTLAVALASCAALGLPALYATQPRLPMPGASRLPLWHDFEALLGWSSAERAREPGFYRIAYDYLRNDHLPTLALVFDQTPIYYTNFTPSQILDKFPVTTEPELLEALSVKYLVSPTELQRPDLIEERRFGTLRVYRFARYRSQPFQVLGAGEAELIDWQPERIALRLRGTDAATRLELHVTSYDRWRATLDGQPVPIATVAVYDSEYPLLMEVPARDGELVFRYERQLADRLTLLLSAAACVVLAYLFVSARRHATLLPELSLPRRWRPRLAAGGAGLLLAVALLLVLRARNRAALLPPDSLFQRLSGAQLTLGEWPCVEREPLSFLCGEHRVEAGAFPGYWGMHLCMRAPDVGPLRLALRTELGSALRGSYDSARWGPGAITARSDGQLLGSVTTRPAGLRQQFFQFDTRAQAGQTAQLELTLSGTALGCFDVRVLP